MAGSLLHSIIMHAYNTVPHYRYLFDETGMDPASINCREDLIKLPILTKDQIQKTPGRFVSSECLYYPASNNLVIQRTSGSTGRFLKIHWTNQDHIRSLFYLWLVRSRAYGVSAASKLCTFHSTIYEGNRIISPETVLLSAGRNLSFSKLTLDAGHLINYYKQIMYFKPVWMMLQPSVAYLLARFMSDNSLEVPQSLKYIELTGEYLFDSYRRKITETFKLPVANMYGCMETNGIAMECPNGYLHCLENNVLIEVLKDGKPVGYGQEGEIHVTCFTNRTMPFIRYSLGDRGILYPYDVCSCGSKSPVLKLLAGRLSEYVLVEGREPINPFVFVYAVESININQGYHIIQFQVIQESYREFTVRLVLENTFEGCSESISKQFLDEMTKLGLAEMNWKFNFADCILPGLESGKLQFFINNIKNKSI